MLDQTIVDKINKQINFEFYSAYLYLDISNYYAENSLNGFANWFKIQTQEEKDHAVFLMDYLINNGAKVTLESIKGPEFQFNDFRTPVIEAYQHELKVTAAINDIYATAYELKDFRTMQFLDWYVKEQSEEEKNTDEIIKRYDLFGNDSKGLYMLDSELASRVYVTPTLAL